MSPQEPASPAEPEVVTERRGAALVVRINRPAARNALSGAVMVGIGNALLSADADPEVRAVILTGTGDRAFCAGLDLKAFAAGGTPSGGADQAGMVAFSAFTAGGGGCAKPVICAAQATALAGGFELALACDLVVVADDARLGLPEVKRGLFAAGGGIQLGRRVPLGMALELALTGDLIDAHRAAAMGIVNAVVPGDRVLDEAVALAERIAANGPMAIAATKRLMRAAFNDGGVAGWELSAELQPAVFGSEDAREGALAFIEHRPPDWKGR